MHKQVLVLQMIGKFRTLGMFQPTSIRCSARCALHRGSRLKTYGFAEATRHEFDVGSLKAGAARMRLRDIITALKDTYCRTLGAEYMYISDTPTKRFVQARSSRSARGVVRRGAQAPDPRAAHCRETLERYLHTSTSGRSASRARAATRSRRCSTT